MLDPVGASLGVAGILLAFKGVVDSANLIADILSSDNGSQYLAMRYRIERRRTDLWGDEMRVADNNSQMLLESAQTRRLITGILSELRATHELAPKYVKRYGMQHNPLDKRLAEEVPTIDGADMTLLLQQRANQKQKSVGKWAARDKAKFTDLVDRMKSLNDNLYDLVRVDHTQTLAAALSAYLIPQIQDNLNLATLQALDVPIDPVLALSARLKQIQIAPSSESAHEVTRLDLKTCFVFEKKDNRRSRETGFVLVDRESPYRAWVEWKILEGLNEKEVEEATLRIATLQVLLSMARSPEYRIPPCPGLLSNTESLAHHANDIGIIYAWPADADASEEPRTLHDLLRDAEDNEGEMPPLNERYTMALALASALSLLHASKWLHRGFRSDNVLFFRNQKGELMYESPYITGFEYSRPQGKMSIERRQTGDPKLDLYYHPDVLLKGFSQIRDLYSLGVMLFEIARWRPISVDLPDVYDGRALGDISLLEIRKFLEEYAHFLDGQVGTSYREAVLACVTGDFGVEDSDQDECPALSPAVFVRVIKKLGHCRA